MLTAFRLFAVLLTVLLSTSIFATTYTFTGSGDWKDPNNWEGGVIAPYTLKIGDTLIVNGVCINEPTQLDEYNYQDVFGSSFGTIIISKDASLTLTNYTQFSHGGRMEIYGTFTNRTAFEAFATDTIIIHSGGLLKNQKGPWYTSFFGNQGFLEVKGGGAIVNEWFFTNDMEANKGMMVMRSGSSFTNTGKGKFIPGILANFGGAIQNTATLSGDAVFNGNLLNTGTIAPGNSPGTYTVKGNYTATSSTVHNFEVGGIAEGQYDVLDVSGTASLNGTLNISFINGFSTISDHEIPIIRGTIKGTFQTVNIPDRYTLVYNASSVVLKSIPIQKVTFSAIMIVNESAKGKLSWTVQNEKDVMSYEVQRGTSAYDFTTIGLVNASKTGQYSFIDENPGLSNYYQVKANYSNNLFSNSQSVHIYYGEPTNTFTGSGNWSDATKWSTGKAPESIWRSHLIVINGNCNYDLGFDIFNYGQIDILQNSTLKISNPFTSQGIMNISGILENNSSFANYEPINLSGSLINNGYFINASPLFKLLDKSTLINASTGSFLSGSIETPNGAQFINNGKLMGAITYKGDLVNDANLSPGNSPGTCVVEGNYTAAPYATHDFEVEGTNTGTYDVLAVSGTVNLDGEMHITLKPGVIISGNTEIPIITGAINGTFSSTTLPEGVILEYKANSVVLKAATALPVRFIRLEGTKQGSAIQLTWKVADENGVLRYEVEKSTDGSQFNRIGAVPAALKEAYQFMDYSPSPVAYYRVKSIDVDGKQGYSQTIMIKGEANRVVLKAFLASSGHELIVQHPTAASGTKIYIHTLDGQLLKVALAQVGTQQSKIDFPFTQSGIYIISYGNDKDLWETIKVFKP